MVIQGFLLWYYQECDLYQIAMSVHAVVLLFSILFIWVLSNSLIRWAIFPYSAWVVYTDHHKSNNRRLADEMIRLFREFQLILKETMVKETKEDTRESMAMYEYKDKVQVIQKLIETNELFMEVNSKLIADDLEYVLGKKRNCSNNRTLRTKKFKQITDIMKKASECFHELQIQPIANPPGVLTNLYEHFVDADDDVRLERDSYKIEDVQPSTRSRPTKTFRQIPYIENSETNKKIYQELLVISEIYIEETSKAIRSCGIGKSRYECCFCFESIFGETEQMGNVLAKNFEGDHRIIEDPIHNPSSSIDSMFFTYNGIMPDDIDYKLDYKDKTTFIICNPNAMFYQHMINYPHAYYLRFFQQRNFNVMIWNYRGYGLSKSTGCCGDSFCRKHPSPDNIKKDGESVLRYMRQTLGLRGKIGVYGRSLGGIAGSHLISYVDMVICDRSFANFDTVIERKFFGKKAVCLYKFAMCCQKADNAEAMVGGMDVDIYLGSDDEGDRNLIINQKGFAPIIQENATQSIEPINPEQPNELETWGPLKRPCYKVITCDIKDEIIDLQSSLMAGAAIQACTVRREQQLKSRKNHEQNMTRVGLLTDQECNIFIDSVKNLQRFEHALHEFISIRLEATKKNVENDFNTQNSLLDDDVNVTRTMAQTMPVATSGAEHRFGNASISLRPPSMGSLCEATGEGINPNLLNSAGKSGDLRDKLDEIINEIQVDAEKVVVTPNKAFSFGGRNQNAKIVDLSNAIELESQKRVSQEHENSYKGLVEAARIMFSTLEAKHAKNLLKRKQFSEDFKITMGQLDLQVALSRALQQLARTKGGNVHLQHILNLNEHTDPAEIQNWISIMEVYGTLPEQSLLKPDIETLYEQRVRSCSQLKLTYSRIKLYTKLIKDNFIDCDEEDKKYKSSGDAEFDKFWNNCCKQVFADISTLCNIFGKITKYFFYKERQAGQIGRPNSGPIQHNDDSNITDDDGPEAHDIPIFDGLEAPSLYEVGNIVNLTCGHAQRPSDSEANLLHQHLVEAGLIPGCAHLRNRQLSERTHRARTISIKRKNTSSQQSDGASTANFNSKSNRALSMSNKSNVQLKQ